MVVAPLTSGASISAVVSGVVAASPPVTVAAVFSSEELPPVAVPLSQQAERHPASSAALMIIDRIQYLRFIFGSSLQSMIP